MPEEEQEIGRQYVNRVKRLLEASMRFELRWDAYQHRGKVSLTALTGATKAYDLRGNHLTDGLTATVEVFIESKGEKTAGSQAAEFKQFLANAYSATKRQWDTVKLDPEYEFMWATRCPWKGTGWLEVATKQAITDAIEADRGGTAIPEDHVVDEVVVDRLAERIWIWVVAERQDEMVPTTTMRAHAMKAQIDGG
jgi:hypothetical protein